MRAPSSLSPKRVFEFEFHFQFQRKRLIILSDLKNSCCGIHTGIVPVQFTLILSNTTSLLLIMMSCIFGFIWVFHTPLEN